MPKDLKIALKVSNFLWPTFEVREDSVFLRDALNGNSSSVESFNSLTEAEIFLNHVHVLDLFKHGAGLEEEPFWDQHHPDFHAACSLGKNALQTWTSKLKTEAPNRSFVLVYTQNDNPIVRFHQKRDGEPDYLDPDDWEREIQVGEVIVNVIHAKD